MPDFGVKASTNQAQTENASKHITFQRLFSLLQDMAINQSGGMGLSSISNLNITKVTTDYAVDVGDTIIYCNASTKVITLPYAADGGRMLCFATQPTGTIQILCQSGDTIGLTSNTFPFAGGYFGGGKFLILMSNGITDWQVVSYGGPLGIDPTGPAGGDLTGTYPNPTIRSINSADVTSVNHAASPYTVLTTDFLINADCTAGAISINLPPATRQQVFIVEKIDAFPSPNIVTFVANGADTINGLTTLDAGGFAILVSDGVSNWYVLIGNRNGTAIPLGSSGSGDLVDNFPGVHVRSLDKLVVVNTSSGTRSVQTNDFLNVATGGAITFALQAANFSSQTQCRAFKALAGCNYNILPNGTDTIDGAASLAGGAEEWAILQSDGVSNWHVISSSRVSGVPPGDLILGSFGITIGQAGGGTPTTGDQGYIAAFPYPCTITKWYIVGDQSGSCVVDIKRSGTSIIGGGGNKPTLSSAQRANAAVSGWTSTSIATNDELQFNLDSVTTINRINLVVEVTKT